MLCNAPLLQSEEKMADNRYQRVYYHGRLMDRYTMEAVKAAEKRLGYELTIIQGSYNAGRVTASAGTHDGGGVIDLAPYDHDRKVRVLRQIGFAAWYRPAIRGLWSSHIHAVLIGNDKLSSSARNQVTAYRNGRNGLANNGPDNGPNIPIHVFHYPKKKKMYLTRGKNVDAALGALNRAVKDSHGKHRLGLIKKARAVIRSINQWKRWK